MIRLMLYRALPHRRGEGVGGHVTLSPGHPERSGGPAVSSHPERPPIPANLKDLEQRAIARAQLRRELKCIRNVDILGQAVRAAAQLPSKVATGATFMAASTNATARSRRVIASTAGATPRAASRPRIPAWTHGRASHPVPTLRRQIREWQQNRPHPALLRRRRSPHSTTAPSPSPPATSKDLQVATHRPPPLRIAGRLVECEARHAALEFRALGQLHRRRHTPRPTGIRLGSRRHRSRI
jgi:hypothetical protein